MVLKGAVQPNHIPVNNYELQVVGLPAVLFTQISGLEEETETTDLPDRTKASGGNTLPVEFTGMSFEHHATELAALELWRREAIGNVSATYKKVGTLIKRGIDGNVLTTRSLVGLWITKRKDADLDLANAGDPAMIEWTFSCDKVESI